VRYVILRDDDANALTPPEMLETLYRPFLQRGLPVQLAVIPEVRTDVRTVDGGLEGFLIGERAGAAGTLPLSQNPSLLDFLRQEEGFHIVQHGLHHDHVGGRGEFALDDPQELAERFDRGRALLEEAGVPSPVGFVAPYDQLSRSAMTEAMKRYDVVSTGWYDLGRVPVRCWPRYLFGKKILRRAHWRWGGTLFLSHPGCILSHNRDTETMRDAVLQAIRSQRLTVVVSHHWEYFPGGQPDEAFIGVLHELAEVFEKDPEIRVIPFRDASCHGP
jgi:hypothetical protein